MSEEKIVTGYYQSNIKTSRNEDSVYAMKYASQQMIINKLQEENKYLNVSLIQKVKIISELEKWLKEMLDSENDIFSVVRVKDVLDKLNELRSKE